MENKINIAELLKDCSSGMELYSPLFGNCTFVKIHDNEAQIIVKLETGATVGFQNDGRYYDYPNAECILFPSKGKTTWEGFQRPFKDGDIVATSDGQWIGITIGGKCNCFMPTYCIIKGDGEFEAYLDEKDEWHFSRLATEDEKAKLFDAIKANGYKWNEETKTLEKLPKPKFKVGDKVRHKVVNKNDVHEINRVHDDSYEFVGFPYTIPMKHQDKFELVPNKIDITTLKPFDKVLVRHNKDNKWCCSFFSHIDKDFHSHCYKYVTIAGKSYPMCIPYEKNEHLLGTTNDCDEYFKNW